MKIFSILTLVSVLAGCVAPAKNLSSASELREGFGIVAIEVDSSWPYENVSSWGRPLSIVYNDGKNGFNDGKLPFSRDKDKIVLELAAGEYSWMVSAIDQVIYINDDSKFKVKAGEVTNLGKVYIDIDWIYPYGPRIYKFSQTDFDNIENHLKLKGVDSTYTVSRECLFEEGTHVSMTNSLGQSFRSKYGCSEH